MTEDRIQNKALWWVVSILTTVVVGGGAGAYTYTQARITNQDDVLKDMTERNSIQNERLATTEAHYDEILRRLNSIDNKLDNLSRTR